jgi:hypothetical protein
MSVRALFGLSVLMSLVASSVFAKLYIWPRVRIMHRYDALVPLVAPHMFLRFIGLSFLVPALFRLQYRRRLQFLLRTAI